MTAAKRVMRAVSGPEWCGNDTVPGDHLTLQIPLRGGTSHDDVQVYATGNDGFDLLIGYPHKWHWSTDRVSARRLAWFILWTWWARGEWFGLRRRIYYRALTAHLDSTIRRRVTP